MFIKQAGKDFTREGTGKIMRRRKRLRQLLRLTIVGVFFLVSVLFGVYLHEQRVIKSLSSLKEDALFFVGGDVIQYSKKLIKGKMSDPEQLVIDMKHEDFQLLAYNRDVALQRGFLLPDCRDVVSATITHNGEQVPVKLRLKGDMPDHWEDPDKWSFRIEVKGENSIMGMKEFSVQNPATRGFLNEYVFHQFLSYSGLIGLRYDFIQLSLNGKDLGIYALEEHFEKRLIENNSRRECPILRFDESFQSYNLIHRDLQRMPEYYEDGFATAPIDVFQTGKIREDSIFRQNFYLGRDLLEGFRQGDYAVSEVFDLEKTALLFAINDLFGQWGWGQHHPLEYRNIRFYFDPFTAKLEPIGFDNGYIYYTSYGGLQVENPEGYYWLNLFFKDQEFLVEYAKALEKVSKKEYLKSFFDQQDAAIQEKLGIIYKEYPSYTFNGKEILFENQDYIENLVNPQKVVLAHFHDYNTGTLRLDVGNLQWMPVKILGVRFNQNNFIPSAEQGSIPVRKGNGLTEYNKFSFRLPAAFIWHDSLSSKIEVAYQIIGRQDTAYEEVAEWKRFDGKYKVAVPVIQTPNAAGFPFVKFVEARKEIIILPGKHTVDRHLIFPKGYTIIAGLGTSVDLINSACMISHSPLKWVSVPENPVEIFSSDSSGQGLIVLNAGDSSILKNVFFHHLHNPLFPAWSIPGAVTFYESPVYFEGCVFSKNYRGDDFLNVVRSNFTMKACLFENTNSDAFDGDFTFGTISNTRFVKPGNDGVDFSGSNIKIDSLTVEEAGDKAVSCGENSKVSITNLIVRNSEIGVAGKDISDIRIVGALIENCRIAYTVYQKKPEFGPGSIVSENSTELNCEIPYLAEEKSYLNVNEKTIQPSRENVKEILYGAEYGKASK